MTLSKKVYRNPCAIGTHRYLHLVKCYRKGLHEEAKFKLDLKGKRRGRELACVCVK